ncbi:MAG: SPOR domain-containing protein [Candidatus Hydrogenedentes bacterium]|nr:SPOR domain-containing protein [Candidatus Hydrogenedentota bacterium]
MPSKGGKDGGGLSQEQMLWVVLALLCTAVLFFAAGILVNKIQSGEKVTSTETGQVERLPGAKDTEERAPEESGTSTESNNSTTTAGVQVSPAPVVMPDGTAGSAPPSRPVTKRDSNTQFVPAPPPQREEASAKPDKPESPPVTEQQAAPTPVADAQPKTEQAAMPASEPAAPAPVSPLDDIEQQKEGESGPAGEFTIQVGSFDTMANAEAFKKAIEAKSDHTVTLYPVKDSKVVKACIGTYDTKEAAAKARAELDRIKDFKGCFVKPLSEL